MSNTKSDIRIAAMATNSFAGSILKAFGPVLDRLVGLSKLRKLYINNDLSGLEKQEFSTKLIKLLGVNVSGGVDILDKVPQQGRFIVVCNHPYGMIEGVILAQLLTRKRKDTKVMANIGLSIFKEIQDYFIFANPLKPKAAINTSAIKQCFKHLKDDGLLILFPAGRVSFFQSDKQRITDAQWNRLTVQLASKTDTPVLPLFICGGNSRLFHNLGRIYYRFRLLMLAREMFKLHQHRITLTAKKAITAAQLKEFGTTEKMNDVTRLHCYLNDQRYFTPWPEDNQQGLMQDIMPGIDKLAMLDELTQLPQQQHLLDYRNFSVYYGYQAQLPHVVQEIARLREVTFRTQNEGSGKPLDTDKFDASYMHLFVFDRDHNDIIGAYRIGLSDVLLKNNDTCALYLSQMFNFSPEFINRQTPCMEMGRSFIVQAHQNSFHGLLLLWKGIGAFVCKNPRYRTLYGTVSLSKLYDPRSVALIEQSLVKKTSHVSAQSPFAANIHPELSDFLAKHTIDLGQLSNLVQTLEDDDKDIPVLLKQYHKLNAKFHCMGVDTNFNHTPGLLLSVHLPEAPDKLLKLYLGAARHQYLAHPRS
jgi:putative hemolysin